MIWAIPVKTICDACSWFGIVIKAKPRERLPARREPASQQGTDDRYVLNGPSVEIQVEVPGENTNADQVRPSLAVQPSSLMMTDLSVAGGKPLRKRHFVIESTLSRGGIPVIPPATRCACVQFVACGQGLQPVVVRGQLIEVNPSCQTKPETNAPLA